MIDYTKEVKLYLKELIDILVDQNYFSYAGHSINYIDDIQLFIKKNISIISKHKASPKLPFYRKGLQYIYYKRNKRTTWYIFFLQQQNKFLIIHITNNHDPNFTNL